MKTCPSNMLMLDQYNLSFLCSLMAHGSLYMKSLIIYIKILLFFFDGLPVRGLQIRCTGGREASYSPL